MLPVDDAFTLQRLYHLNSEPWLNLEAYADPSHEMVFKSISSEGESLPLPKRAIETACGQWIARRRSCRKFADKPMPLEQFGTLLGDAFGITGVVSGPDGQAMYSRAAPSAGALYPLEIYAVTRRVEGLADRLYHYQCLDHALEPVKDDAPIGALGDLLLGQHFLEMANAALIFTAVFERTLKKYGPRGYRYILLEAGHTAQNVCLLATEMGLSTICTGGFYDTRLNRYLGLDGVIEAAVYVVGVGAPIPSE
jgi:SagB-type dehydrogenase family enzyme